ncbi:hypothetical protein Q7A53_02590 [Halobacillus rhizosphaerae]|uniref:hypothetical protein n=1 Tax=Halobacillus rhizosphaerae TaxID=3064889 RepID=UPI00398B651F
MHIKERAHEKPKEGELSDWEEEIEMEVLHLPPRKEVHRKEDAKNNVKVGRIFLRVMLLIFIMLIIVALSYRDWHVWLGGGPVFQ